MHARAVARACQSAVLRRLRRTSARTTQNTKAFQSFKCAVLACQDFTPYSTKMDPGSVVLIVFESSMLTQKVYTVESRMVFS